MKRFQPIVLQLALIGALAAAVWGLAAIVAAKMRTLGVEPGFGFLLQRAGFDIGEQLIDFDAGDTYGRAFVVGLLNTVRVAVVAIAGSLLLGFALGLGQLSRNRLLAGVCEGYVELFRNVPLLLQVLIVYVLLLSHLPMTDDAWSIGDTIWLSKSGLAIPWLSASPSGWQVDWPVRGRFTFEGGAVLTPEYMAVTLSLLLFTSAYIAETVRGAVLAVSTRQREAALALGLSEAQSLRFVVVPQALHSMIPPLANQLLNLIKNSSLAVAVGYPDLVAIADTTLNQSGHAVECIAIIMVVYLSLSLFTAALMALWHRRLLHRQIGA